MEKRERLGSRLGFILLSAGCAIGCGNVWRFPWMTGEYGGGGFVLVYIICLLLLGLPVMVMEFSMGRAAQASPVRMYQKLEKPGQKWHIHGYFALLGNIALMAFYTVITGWMMYYFVQFLLGNTATLDFGEMVGNAKVNVGYLLATVVIAFVVLSFDLQKGLERVTKYLMTVLFALMLVLAVHSATLEGAREGLRFYLVPDFSKINGKVIVEAMNQAFFTLSLGIGSMAIFGSYIGKERSLMGESVNIILLDTFVAITAGLIIFPACTTYNTPVDAGPGLLFSTMLQVFNHMGGGRIWGTLFFLFMVFAAFSTVLAVLENILACVREMTGWSRPMGSLICGVGIFLLALTTALNAAWIDRWDFIVSTNLLPLGSLIFAVFCCFKFGWGWKNFMAEANSGKGLKVKDWMKPLFMFFVPICILGLYIIGLSKFF